MVGCAMSLDIIYTGSVSPELIDLAKKELMEVEGIDATMEVDASLRDHAVRNTIVRYAPEWHWFNGVLYQFGLEANIKMGWNFQINQRETIQFAEYKTNQHYNWHMDTFLLSGQATDRKITVVCVMSDPEEYVGGSLQLQNLKGETIVPELKKGDMIAFPSFLLHRVTPVGAGTRYSAAMWLSGPAFR